MWIYGLRSVSNSSGSHRKSYPPYVAFDLDASLIALIPDVSHASGLQIHEHRTCACASAVSARLWD